MVPEKENIKQERSTIMQALLGTIAYFTIIAPNMSIGFSAVALPALVADYNSHKLSPSEASWFASIASVATPIGCFLSGPVSDRFGRRSALLLVNVVSFFGWIILAIAYDFPDHQYPILLVGRLFTGLSTGLASMPATVYVAEISSPHLRSMFTTASAIFIGLGILAVYFLGYIFQENWGRIALITAILPCIAMVLDLFYLPESPTWLVSKNRIDEASKSMVRIFGYDEYTTQIYDEVQTLVRNRDASKINSVSGEYGVRKSAWASFMKKLRYLRKPTCLKPFIIITIFFLFQQFSGTFVIVFYCIDIVREAGVTMDPYLAINLVAFTRFLAAILVCYVSRSVGRRSSSIFSGVGMTICMLVLAIYLYLIYLEKLEASTIQSLSWLPVSCLVLYFFTSTLGFLSMPFAMSAEIFPSKIRGTATGLVTCLAYTFNFIVVKIYPTMIEGMMAHGVFFFFGIVSLIGTIFVIFVLPETKGKTLQEIEEYFGKRKSIKTPIIKSTHFEEVKMING